MLTQRRDRDGYWRVKIGGRPVPVHQLVMLAFTGPCPAGQEVRHLNGQDDNRWVSLCYGTHAENERDKLRQVPPAAIVRRPTGPRNKRELG